MTKQKDPSSNKTEAKGSVSALADSINKKHGEGAIMNLGATENLAVEAISSGSLALDRALGTGGYARGRIIEVFGPESSGKTTLTLHAIASVQARGGTAAFIDAEHAFDTRYAKALGVDLARLLVAQPDCGEQGLDIAATLVESGSVDLVVVDSVAALVPKAEIDGEMGDAHMGLHARLMSRGVRRITGDASRTKTTVIFINQLRQKIGVVFGNPETTTGGMALRFFASVRLDVRRIGKVQTGDVVTGNRTRVKVVKNKLSAPFQEAEFDIRFGKGIDSDAELLDLGLEAGVLTRAGSYISFGDKSLGAGRERASALLAERADLRADLVQRLGLSTPPEARPDGARVVDGGNGAEVPGVQKVAPKPAKAA